MIIAAVGDIMPGGVLHGREGQFVSDDVLAFLQQADIRVGTLETAVGDVPSFYKEKMDRKADVIYVKDDDLKRLVELDINIVSLANNHFFDLGPDGAIHAMELLDSLGIHHCGAGRNLEEASRPVVFEKDGESIAFLAFCDWREETVGWCPFATETDPGVNPMFDDYVVEQILKCKRQYDYGAVIPHWGKEHTFITTKPVYELANRMIDAGADIILGGHTHRIQPVVRKQNAIIAYSLGNFFFPDRLITSPRSSFYPENPIDYEALPITDGYPFVSETTLKIWKPFARIGEIVSVVIDNGKPTTRTDYVRLDGCNVLRKIALPFPISLLLGWQVLWLVFLPYSAYVLFITRIRKIAKRLLHRRY